MIRLQRDIAEGLQLEDLHAFDLALPAGRAAAQPGRRGRGRFALPAGAPKRWRWPRGDAMTVDAALVTLDFALRHRLLRGHERCAPAASMRRVLRSALAPRARPLVADRRAPPSAGAD